MREKWDHIFVEEMNVIDTENYPMALEDPFKAKIKLNLDGIDAKDVGLEVVFFKRIEDNELDLKFSKELSLTQKEGHLAVYECELMMQMSGVYEYGFRLFPKHERTCPVRPRRLTSA